MKVAEDVLRTAGAPASLRLVPEAREVGSGFDDVVAVRVEVVDAKGVLVPDASHLVTVKIDGPATLAAFDNASVTDHSMFDSPSRSVQGGKAVAFVRGARGSGAITVTATAPGLRAASATLRLKP